MMDKLCEYNDVNVSWDWYLIKYNHIYVVFYISQYKSAEYIGLEANIYNLYNIKDRYLCSKKVGTGIYHDKTTLWVMNL